MAISVVDKTVSGRPSFSLTVYEPPLKHVRGNIYKTGGIDFVIDYAGSPWHLIRLANNSSENIVYEPDTKLTGERKRIAIKTVFETEKIIKG